MTLALVALACIFIALAAISVWLYGARLLSCLGRSCLGVRVLSRLQPLVASTDGTLQKMRVMLTIDDAPFGDGTNLLEALEVAQEYGAPLTLFVIGSQLARADSAIVDALRAGVAAGDVALCNHGRTDTAHWRLDTRELLHEVRACESVCEELALPLLPYYRPGHGWFSSRMAAAVSTSIDAPESDTTALGMPQLSQSYALLLGDVYPHDPTFQCASLNLTAILATVRDGSVVILHDRPWTPALLRRLLPALHERNFECVIVPSNGDDNMWLHANRGARKSE